MAVPCGVRPMVVWLVLACACDSCTTDTVAEPDDMPVWPEPPALPELAPARTGELTDVLVTYGQWGVTQYLSLRRDRCFHDQTRRGISSGTDDFARYRVRSCTGCLPESEEPLLEALRALDRASVPSAQLERPLRIDLGEGPPAPFPNSRVTAVLTFSREGEEDSRGLTEAADDVVEQLTRLQAAVQEATDPDRCVEWETPLL